MNKKQKILYILIDIFVIGIFLVMPFFNSSDFHKKLASHNTTFAASVCGDGVCSGWENSSNCPEDCSGGGGGGGSSCVCGDGYCNPSCENSSNCPEDCGSGSSCVCGDGYCNPSCENSYNCPEDCSGGSSCVCGDGYCNPSCENSYNCPEDCGSPPPSCQNECSYSGQRRCFGAYSYQVCGNYDSDSCLEWSSPQSCPSDKCIGTTWRHYYCSCGQCKYTDTRCSSRCYSCGDGTCNSECGENSSNCPQDCGPSCQNECSYSGQTQKRCYQNDVQKRVCGNYDSDPCLEWSSWQTIQDCGESGWTNKYRCSSHYLQRKYINRGCSNAQCYANEEWRNYRDCGQDEWTNNYRCSGNWVQREKIKRGCSNNQCYQNSQWINYQNCEEEGKICQDGQCVWGCEDECSFIGQKRCANDSSYQICGNYDDDVCLEWSSPTSCGEDSCIGSTFRDYFCTGWGICTYQDTQCSSRCYSCGDGTCNSECGENSSNCPQDCGYPELNVSCYAQPNPAQVNENVSFIASVSGGTGNYTYLWSGACSGNQATCSTSFSQAGSYSSTITVTSGDQTKTASCCVIVNEPQCECSAWSNWQNQGCGQGGCAANQMYQIRTRDCNPDGCDIEQESRCVEDSTCQPQNDPVSGTLSVSPTSLCVGGQINLTISGQDDDGLSGFYAYFQGNWHWQDVSGTSGTKTWTIIENTPGVYTYCGQVYGKTPQGITETANTSPYCVNVNVSSCQPSCTNECSYVGQVRCYDSTHRQICGNYDSDACLEWSSPEVCSGPTNCGYGNCASNQRPSWYCSNGTCTYSCRYDSSCETPQNYLSCWQNDVWWFSGSTHQPLSKYQECGEDSCGDWQDKYCQGNKVYQKRICYERGCANGSCYSNQYTDTRLVEECAPDETCVDGECKKECECSSGPCCDGCHYKPATSVCDVEIDTQYGCPWGTGCGADVAKRTRSKFRYCSGNSASCNGRWGSWSEWSSWRVADYCTINEVCRPGYQKCQYRSSCASPGPSYIKHYRKVCIGNSLWWYDSNDQKQDKYRDCIDNNTCTQDFCENGKCIFELKCDGTTCPVGSQDYCQNCEHCGDGVCNCQEDICSCPQDCKIEGISISLLAKLEKQATEWQDEVKVEAGDIVDFLLVISNHGEETLSNLNVKIDLPSQIQYLDEAKSEGQAILGDLENGVNIGNIEPKTIKTITFKGKIASKELLHDISTLESLAYVQGDGLSASDSVKFTIKAPLAAGGLKGAMIAALKDILKGWLIWLLLILLGIVALFMAGFYLLFWLVKKRREKEMKTVSQPPIV